MMLDESCATGYAFLSPESIESELFKRLVANSHATPVLPQSQADSENPTERLLKDSEAGNPGLTEDDPGYIDPGSLAELEDSEQQDVIEILASAQALPLSTHALSGDQPSTQHHEQGTEDSESPVQIEDLRLSLNLIRLLKKASIANDFVSEETKHQLSNPPIGLLDLSQHPDTLLGIKIFLTISSREPYEAVCADIRAWSTGRDVKLPSFYQVKKIIQSLTGVTSVATHMCINSCLAYVADYEKDEFCETCGEARYDQVKFRQSGGVVKEPRRVFHTVPLGPVLQALWRSEGGAAAFGYRAEKTKKVKVTFSFGVCITC